MGFFKKKDPDNPPEPTEKPPSHFSVSQLISTITISWISISIGYSIAYTSPALPTMEKDLKLNNAKITWIGALMPLGAIIGGLLGGPLIQFIGRKITAILAAVLFLVSWTFNVFAQNYIFMYISRFIVGLTVGITSLVTPVYMGEILHSSIRGQLGLIPTLFGNSGILFCFLMGVFLTWRNLAIVGFFLPVPFLFLIWLVPESPRWYTSKGKEEKSRKALQWLRKKDEDVEKEYLDMVYCQLESDKKKVTLAEFFSRANIKPLLILIGLMTFQQLSGINAVMFYTTTIFGESGTSIDPSICTTIVGIINFLSTFIATQLIDRLGRKILLYISSLTMIVTLAILGINFYLLKQTQIDMKPYGWIPVSCFTFYVLGFSLGFGPIPWLMMGELLPIKIRGAAGSFLTAYNWTWTFVITKTFLLLVEVIDSYGTFWLFNITLVFAFVFTLFFVPETKGQTLEDIEREISGVGMPQSPANANKPGPAAKA